MGLQSLLPGKENVCGWNHWIWVVLILLVYRTKIYTEDKTVKLVTLSEGQELPVFVGFTPNSPKICYLIFSATKLMLDF